MEQLGQKIREERRRQGLTLAQMAQAANLSISFLSQVERNIFNPSLSSAKKIAHALGLSSLHLMQENHDYFPHPSGPRQNLGQRLINLSPNQDSSPFVNDVRIIRRDRRRRLSFPGSKFLYELLTPDLNRLVEVLYLRAMPGDGSGDDLLVDPPGDKFCILLKGKLEVKIHEELFQLEAGDSIYFPANFPHGWRGVGQEPIEAIIVAVPPDF